MYDVKKISTLSVILKTVERCNINCRYCYYFNGENQSYKDNPPYINEKTIEDVAKFLQDGAIALKLTNITIFFHGGEPLMQKKHQFDSMCETLKSYLASHVELLLQVQTNGMLVDDEWIDLFCKHQVGVGVSLDGPAEYNDIDRIDHRMRGTYARVEKGINLLQRAAIEKRIPTPSALAVINPQFDAKVIYDHFVHQLRFKSMDFLLPDDTHDHPPAMPAEEYGRFLCDLFDCWINDDNQTIRIRILRQFIRAVFHKKSSIFFSRFKSHLENAAITIQSNGDIGPNDTLRTTQIWNLNNGANIYNKNLVEALDGELFHVLDDARLESPEGCRECCWENICGGGQLIHRYSAANAFNNPSVMCSGLKHLYAHVTAHFLSIGVPFGEVTDVLLDEAVES